MEDDTRTALLAQDELPPAVSRYSQSLFTSACFFFAKKFSCARCGSSPAPHNSIRNPVTSLSPSQTFLRLALSHKQKRRRGTCGVCCCSPSPTTISLELIAALVFLLPILSCLFLGLEYDYIVQMPLVCVCFVFVFH
eukprot:c19747_g4_i1.p1 GENE.c19747_g4_i1~~c19747_g4_i1.p1  ORF type:complete len:137 (+),score=8.65 c19747_g4_i1:51-461(+)